MNVFTLMRIVWAKRVFHIYLNSSVNLLRVQLRARRVSKGNWKLKKMTRMLPFRSWSAKNVFFPIHIYAISVFCFWGESTVSANMKMAFYFYGPHSRRPGPFTFIVFEYLLVLLNVGVGNAICTKDNIQKFLLTFFCVRSRELSSLVRSLFRFHLELVKQKCCSRSKNLSVRARTYTFI